MNNGADSHYIVANHLSSKQEYFPENKPQSFHLKLGRSLTLEAGRWKVAICELDFVNIGEYASHSSTPAYYHIIFSASNGILIDGNETQVIRVFPHVRKDHIVFDNLYYFPVNISQMDTCFIQIQAFSPTGAIEFSLKSSSTIYVTLHLKKCYQHVYV